MGLSGIGIDLDSDDCDAAFPGIWTRGLLIRRKIADGDLAFFSTCCPVGTSMETLVTVEGPRWAVEDSFETAKNEFGLDHNETRSWRGRRRHVSLVVLAFAMMAVIRHRMVALAAGTPSRSKESSPHIKNATVMLVSNLASSSKGSATADRVAASRHAIRRGHADDRHATANLSHIFIKLSLRTIFSAQLVQPKHFRHIKSHIDLSREDSRQANPRDRLWRGRTDRFTNRSALSQLNSQEPTSASSHDPVRIGGILYTAFKRLDVWIWMTYDGSEDGGKT